MTEASSILTIDLAALAENYRIVQTAARGAEVAGVVKADAYRLGLAQIGPALAGAGCRTFFVTTVDEGAALRACLNEDGIAIFVLNPVLAGNEAALARHRLVPVLNSLGDIEHWRFYGGGAPAALQFDTGINRLGLPPGETARVLDDPAVLGGVNIVLGMSHFASSEDPADPLNDEQAARFAAILPRLPAMRRSLCNSSAVFRLPRTHYDLVRPGYALYGGNPVPHAPGPNPMRPVVSLEARVLQARPVQKGDAVGYNATYRFETNDEIAVAALGYADGFPRSAGNRAQVYWRGQPCPVVGHVSMDLTVIRTGHLAGPKPKPGDMIEILGPRQGIDALAAAAQTNGYEILTRLGARPLRRYKQAG